MNQAIEGAHIHIPDEVCLPAALAIKRNRRGVAWVPRHLREEVEREVARHKIRKALDRPIGDAVALLREMLSEFE